MKLREILVFIAALFFLNKAYGEGLLEDYDLHFEFGKKQLAIRAPGISSGEEWGLVRLGQPSFTNGVSTIIISAEPTEAREIGEVLDQIREEALDAKDRPYDPNSVRESEVIINGIRGKEIAYDWEIVPGEMIDKVRHIFFIKDGLLIECYFAAPSARRAENEPVFDAVVRSIRVEDAPPKVGYAAIEWRKDYMSPDGIIGVEVPYGWELVEHQNDPEHTGVIFAKAQRMREGEGWEEWAEIEIYVWKEGEFTEEELRREENKGYWENGYKEASKRVSVKEIEIAGVIGYEVRVWRPLYRDLHPEKDVMVRIHFNKGGRAYRITYQAIGKSFDEYEKVFKECLRSFRVLR